MQAEKLGLFPSRDPFDWFGMAAGLHHLPYGLMAADRHGGLADRTFSLPTQVWVLARSLYVNVPDIARSLAYGLAVGSMQVGVRRGWSGSPRHQEQHHLIAWSRARRQN